MQPGSIIVYDSGVGGLTVARRFMRRCPGHDLVYLADNGWFPYGNKDEGRIAKRVHDLLSVLSSRFKPAAIVVACNTASTAVADRLGHDGPVPFYGVIPPVGRAASVRDGGSVALLATPATLERGVVKRLVAAHKAGRILTAGSLDLVYLAEQKLADPQSVNSARVVGVLEALMPTRVRAEVTTVILSCTHFPLLRPELRTAFPNARRWLDPAAEVAEAVRRALPTRAPPDRPASYFLLLTSTHNEAELRRVFAAQGFTRTAGPGSTLLRTGG